jgi:transcriptional regulator with XRE-family HTH domain
VPIADVLDEHRRAAGLSWDQVAARAGITTAGLRRIRRGEVRPRTPTLVQLEIALRLPPGALRDIPVDDPPRRTYADVVTGRRIYRDELTVVVDALRQVSDEQYAAIKERATEYVNFLVTTYYTKEGK